VQDVEAGKIRGRAGAIIAVVGTLIITAILAIAWYDTSGRLLGPPSSPSYTLVGPPDERLAPQLTDLHLLVTALDDSGLLTIRVDGYQRCRPTCQSGEQLVLVALREDAVPGRHLPPAAIVPLPAVSGPVIQTVQLPVRVQTLRYPFDAFDLVLGLALLQTDETVGAQNRPPDEAGARMHVTLQSDLPQLNMAAPVPRDATSLNMEEEGFDYFAIDALRFSRWRAGQGLVVVLVVLIAAAAAYAVFLRPLHDLILSTGGLVLGVWGIRSVLVPSNIGGRTGVDVALALLVFTPRRRRGARRHSARKAKRPVGRSEDPPHAGAGVLHARDGRGRSHADRRRHSSPHRAEIERLPADHGSTRPRAEPGRERREPFNPAEPPT
jgi:hypothetical protein